ncbi:hypothetical protein DPEC_G00261120 [Dallia pectoralis]|uniref:Uncharacterized protein n=1 Tax=Dallia pectoralis TaxID=75939 RepID=A0ACC2FRR3_DALPE|nr:hypothetical protein DPEC_G00261120 [Dallia pectoralis]
MVKSARKRVTRSALYSALNGQTVCVDRETLGFLLVVGCWTPSSQLRVSPNPDLSEETLAAGGQGCQGNAEENLHVCHLGMPAGGVTVEMAVGRLPVAERKAAIEAS